MTFRHLQSRGQDPREEAKGATLHLGSGRDADRAQAQEIREGRTAEADPYAEDTGLDGIEGLSELPEE